MYFKGIPEFFKYHIIDSIINRLILFMVDLRFGIGIAQLKAKPGKYFNDRMQKENG
jgi:hypothetical protein